MSFSSSLLTAGGDDISAPTSSYKCTTCLVSFQSPETYRAHMQGDGHVYNLKRRISSLSPVSSTVFNEQVVHSSVTSQEREDFSIQETCEVCRKVFHSRHAYQGHLRSQNHARNVAVVDLPGTSTPQDDTPIAQMNAISLEVSGDSDAERSQETPEEEFIASVCLFCPVVSLDMLENVTHMQKIHGLFIPDQEHLIDMESFLGYIFTIISEFQECLYCSITKSTPEGIQHHMKDKGHCKINFTEESEWRLFYEYSDSESDAENPKSHLTTSHTTDGRNVFVDDKLHLFSGKILGHRSQTRHHRPNAQGRTFSTALTAPSLTEPAATSPVTTPSGTNEARTSQQLTVRSSDRLGMIGVPAQQQRALRTVEKMMLMRESRARNAYQAAVQKAGNRQKFFKADVPGRSNG